MDSTTLLIINPRSAACRWWRLVVLSENSIRPGLAVWGRIIASFRAMFAILYALRMFVADMFKSRCRLEAKTGIVVCQSLRHRTPHPKHFSMSLSAVTCAKSF